MARVNVASVLRIANRCSIEVRITSPMSPSCNTIHPSGCFHAGPVHGGICTKDWAVYWPSDSVASPGGTDDHALLHELAHVLDIGSPSPAKADEMRGPMLAWEYHVGRYLHLRTWRAWMEGFSIDGIYTYNNLSLFNRTEMLDCSRDEAVRIGILTRDFRPTFRNPRKESMWHA